MGSAHSVEAKVRDYENPLVRERPESPPIVEIMFQLALDAGQSRVILVADPSMRDGDSRFNPFVRLKTQYEKLNQVVCLEHLHVHQMKNTTGVDVNVRIRSLFSMPPDHKFDSGVPRDPSEMDEGRPHPDDTNELTFTVPSTDHQFIPAGIRIYKKRVGDGKYERWAGMDYAFKEPVAQSPPGEAGEDPSPPPPPIDFEVFTDAHAFIRALRMHKTSLGYSDTSWSQKTDERGNLVHKVPKKMAQEVRRKMRNTFFRDRRYTTFHGTSVVVDVTPEIQARLNEQWLEELKKPGVARPIIQVTLSLLLVTFGEGDHKMNIIQLVFDG